MLGSSKRKRKFRAGIRIKLKVIIDEIYYKGRKGREYLN